MKESSEVCEPLDYGPWWTTAPVFIAGIVGSVLCAQYNNSMWVAICAVVAAVIFLSHLVAFLTINDDILRRGEQQ